MAVSVSDGVQEPAQPLASEQQSASVWVSALAEAAEAAAVAVVGLLAAMSGSGVAWQLALV